ncbi:Unknown protein, partial [Striga hermonthica]
NQNVVPPANGMDQAKMMGHFQKMDPPIFTGKEGPAHVDEWFMTMEDIFEIMAEKYYPQHYHEQLESEFWNLTQGSLTVDEYEREFTKLSYFVEHLVDTDVKRAKKFRRGLKPTIRHLVASHGDLPYAETVGRALQIEASIKLEKEATLVMEAQASGSNKKRKFEHPKKKEEGGQALQPRPLQQVPAVDRQECHICGKKHRGECLLGQNICFCCKKPGHFRVNCPGIGQPPPPPQQNLPPARQGRLGERAPARLGMLDLGAGINLMPFSIFQRLGLGDLRPTRMFLQLADRSIRYPKGVVEVVLVHLGKLIVPVDFVVLDVGDVQENGKDHTILLGRPFMATTNTLIDVRNGTLNMTVLGECVSISVRGATSASSVNCVEECAFVDMSDPFVEEVTIRDMEERLMPDLEEEKGPFIELMEVEEPRSIAPPTLELKELPRHH